MTAEVISLFSLDLFMVIPVLSMHMPMRDFLLGRRPHLRHIQAEPQRDASKWVVAIQHDLIVCDISHSKNQGLVALLLSVRSALKLHADLNGLGQTLAVLDLDQFRIVLTKSILRLHLNHGFKSSLFAVQHFLDFGQGVRVAAMQIHHRLAAFLDQIALRIRQFVMHRYDSILGNLHDSSSLPLVNQSPVDYNHPTPQTFEHYRARYNPSMLKTSLLGELSPTTFLQRHWHKQPLLVRQAIPGFKTLLSKEELFDLASQDEVESRLITQTSKGWQLRHGPLETLPSVRQKAWTLLVQGVNLHNRAASDLLQQFRFLPDARLDDLMISYATNGGGVGPHFDSYDVFLLQAHGKRKWRISAQKDLSLLEDQPLKILRNFRPEQEFILEPGDMLYLPPQYAHDGIAMGECMTYSIGFRAPTYQELGEAFLQFMADSIELPGRYADPDLAESKHPAEIGKPMLERIARELGKIRFNQDDIALFLGEYLTEPKANVFFDPPTKTPSLAQFKRSALKQRLSLSGKTRMLYAGRHLFINGEAFSVKGGDKRLLSMLANARYLPGQSLQNASEDVWEALHLWYSDGWVELG